MKVINENIITADSPHLPSRYWGRGGLAGMQAGQEEMGRAASHPSRGPCSLKPWVSACLGQEVHRPTLKGSDTHIPAGALPCHHVSQHTITGDFYSAAGLTGTVRQHCASDETLVYIGT